MSVCASSLAFIDGSVLNVALPAIRQNLGASAAEVQWVVNGFTLPLAALILIGGALGDHQGRRRWLVIGTALFGFASLVCALSRSFELLVLGRALQGVGAALLLPNSLALLNGVYEGEARGRAIGIWAAAGAISAAFAPLLGGWLVEHVGWPAIFYINLPFAAAAIIIALTRVAEVTGHEKTPIDARGASLATLGLGALTYGLTLWSSQLTFSTMAGATIGAGLILLAVFIWTERRADSKAMIPMHYFSNPCFSSLNLMTFLLYGAFGSALLLIPYVLIAAGGYSPIEAGLALVPFSILIAVGSPFMGQLAARIGPKWPLTIGPLVVAAGLFLGARIASGQDYWTDVLPSVAMMALGMAIAVAPLTSSVLASVDSEHTGMVSGFNSALSRAGGLVGVALLGAVLANEGRALLGPFTIAMFVCAVVAAIAGVVAFLGLSTPAGRKVAAAVGASA
ncbi:MAG TPA: MFS transporter [Sphingomicrobium sp.]|nr:MFS transporter [Sphingomicrobium sp.]